jgi:hypothetical protein
MQHFVAGVRLFKYVRLPRHTTTPIFGFIGFIVFFTSSWKVADFVKHSDILADLHAVEAGEQLDALVQFARSFLRTSPSNFRRNHQGKHQDQWRNTYPLCTSRL